MIKLMFLNRSFEPGGAERQLIELLKGLDKQLFDITVVTFYGRGALWDDVNAVPGIRVLSLEKSGRWDTIPFLMRLWQTIAQHRPQIIHGYLDLPNIFSLIGKIYGAKVVWGIRNSDMNWRNYHWLLRIGFELQCWLSWLPDLIICNSHAGRDYHISHGFPTGKTVVISNGIDIEHFRPDEEARKQFRNHWGVTSGGVLVGVVARLDPMKDHATFLRAAARIADHHAKVRFVCVGGGPQPILSALVTLTQELGIAKNVIWAGPQNDMVGVYNALDIFTLTSLYGEGFPNVVAEAMACGIPCVVTDVGDAAQIVGSTGIVVPPSDPQALAKGWDGILQRLDSEPAIHAGVRRHIIDEFSSEKLARRTTERLLSLFD